MSIVGLDHVQLAGPPGCEPAARRFYGELLGLHEIEKPAGVRASGGVWFAVGNSGQELHIGIQEPFAPATKAHPGLLVALGELLPLAERLTAGGVVVAWDDRIAGVERCFVSDPSGNRLELRAAGRA